jgi:formylglycine-generating enzyme required for sulfatase activity
LAAGIDGVESDLRAAENAARLAALPPPEQPVQPVVEQPSSVDSTPAPEQPARSPEPVSEQPVVDTPVADSGTDSPAEIAQTQPEPAAAPRSAKPGDEYSDPLGSGGVGPRMIELAPGQQLVGNPNGTAAQQPVHQVNLVGFAISKYEVTRGDFSRFVDATGYQTSAEIGSGCNYWLFGWRKRASKNWRSVGFKQKDDHPVVCVSRTDGEAYAKWVSEETGHQYALPSEAQWEYAARAGADSIDYWTRYDLVACRFANVSDLSRANDHELVIGNDNVFRCADGHVTTSPIGSFIGNDFQVFDMLGNAGEWVADCWHSNYQGAPEDGQPWQEASCDYGTARGGSWYELPAYVTATFRLRIRADQSFNHIGFRVIRVD